MFTRIALLVALFATLPLRADVSSTASSQVVAVPPRERLQIYLLMGQSNMVGRDTAALGCQLENRRILALNSEGQWVVAREPMHERGTGIGPGIPFALEMLKTDSAITIGLVPCAVGGTSLRHWMKGGDLYAQALDRARRATEHGVLKGVLWHQGESDATNAQNAETYAARLSAMIADFRQDLGVSDLPVVLGQLGGFLPASKYPHADTVRAAIRQVAGTTPNVGFADSTGLADKGDKLHFSAAAEKELGIRYALAMRRLQTPRPSPPPPRR